MVNGDELGKAGFKYLGTPYSQMDCQAFVERCLRDCGCNKDLAGSNAWYREVYNNGMIMTPEACVNELGKVPEGAFLFILEFDGGEEKRGYYDGLGNATHIGIVTGTGKGAIHSSGSRGGVCESEFKGKTIPNGGWNRVGLWDQVSYDYGGGGVDPQPEPEPTPEPAPVYYEVWSPNGKPVNTRKGPGKGYAQAGPGKLPVGTPVEFIDSKNGWCKIRVVDEHDAAWVCWMQSDFLVPMYAPEPEPEPTPSTYLYTVTIRHLTEYDAEALKARYDGAVSIEREE